MKKWISVCFLLSIVLLAAACSRQVSVSPTDVPAAEAPKEETVEQEPSEPKTGGSITIAISQDLDQSLDPHTSTSAGKREIFFNIFEGLVKADPDGNFVPALAESWDISDDAVTFTFKLRQGVKFHNGSEMTAEDVVYTLDK